MKVEVKIYRNVPFLVCSECNTIFPRMNIVIKKEDNNNTTMLKKEKVDEIFLMITCDNCKKYKETQEIELHEYLKRITIQNGKECYIESKDDLLYCGLCQKWFCKSCREFHDELSQEEYIYDKESQKNISQHFYIDREIIFYSPCSNDNNAKINLGYLDPITKKEGYMCDICDYQNKIADLEIHSMRKTFKELLVKSKRLEELTKPVNSFVEEREAMINTFLRKTDEKEYSLYQNNKQSNMNLLPKKKEDIVKSINVVKEYNKQINRKITDFFTLLFQNLYFFFTYK